MKRSELLGTQKVAVLSVALVIVISITFWIYAAVSWMNPKAAYELAGPQENYYWGTAQFELKLEAFKYELMQYAFANELSFDELELSYNILLSKYFIMTVNGDATKAAMAIPNYRRALADLHDPLYSVLPYFDKQKITRRDAEKILGTLDVLAPDVARLVQSIGDAEMLRRQLSIDDFKSKQLFFLKLSTGLVAIVLLAFVGIMWLSWQLRKNIIRERELQEIKTAFLGMVGHELRSPLQVVTSVIDNFANEELSRSAMKGVFALERAAHQIDVQLRDIADFALLGSSRLKMESRWFGMLDVVNAAIDSQRELARQKRIDIEVEIGARFPQIFSDGDRVQQVITNLVSNALKYSMVGPVRVRIDGHAYGTGTGPQSRFDLSISVLDRGVGISEADQQRIFRPFVRVTGARSGQVSGIGMGLAIVQEIVDLLNGAVSVRSTLEAGSEFTVLIPCESRPPPGDAAERDELAAPAYSADIGWIHRALVVDDNSEIVTSLMSVFKSRGIDVDGVSSIGAARELLSTKRYQAVVLDIQMPEMSGFHFLELARRTGLIDDGAIVIALSAYSPELFDAADRNSFDVFLSKPLRADELFRSLSRIARAKGIQ